jgi:hypothetical protein
MNMPRAHAHLGGSLQIFGHNVFCFELANMGRLKLDLLMEE